MTVIIQGMSCNHCAAAVEKALKPVKGIKNLKVEIGKVTFDVHGKIDESKIRLAIEEAGYTVTGIEA